MTVGRVSLLLGLGLAVAGIRMFDATVTAEVGKPYWMTFTMDPIVFGFLVAVCLATGIAFGLAPALHVSRTDVNEVLKEAGGRSGTGGMRARRWTSALVTAEIVLTLVLLAGAGFMMRSFLVLYRADLGFDPAPLLTMRLFLPLTKYPDAEPRAAIAQQIEDRLSRVSAWQAVGLTTNTPSFGGFLRQLTVEGRPGVEPERRPEITMVAVSDGYFDAIGVPLLRGRGFNRQDGLAGHESVIVNQRFVAMHFATEEPLGRRITLIDPFPSPVQSTPKTATIVGVVPALRQRAFQEPTPDPVAYLPFRADPQRGAVLVVRVPGSPGRVSSLVREEMRAIEPDVPLVGIQTMNQLLAMQRWSFRVFGSMFAIFAAIALVLSAVGLYAVTAYSATLRTAEIGVRRALGAQSADLVWLLLRRGLVQLAVGVPVGIAGAVGVGRMLQSLLVRTPAGDLPTIGGIALLMIGVSVAACLLPARRATRLDPVAALRCE